MKKVLTLLSILLIPVGSAMAVPYASLIRLSNTTFSDATGTTITYVLNEAADSTTITVKDSSNIPVAGFVGTAAQGLNAVHWDGTVDNAGGALLPDATGYYLQITADKNDPTTYTMYAINSSGAGGNGQVFSGFSPNAVAIPNDQTSDLFGIVLAAHSWDGASHTAAGIQFRTDLKTADGADGFASRAPKFPGNGTTKGDGILTENGSIWGLTMDPDGSDAMWACGQDAVGPQWMGAANSAGLDASLVGSDDPTTPVGLLYPRDIAVDIEGGTKYAYFARSNGVVGKVAIIGGQFSQPTLVANILSLAGATQYLKDLSFDSAGNLYWTAKSTAPAPRVYRWDAAQVQAITSAGGTPLTEANATWVISFPGGTGGALGTAVAGDGKVYALSYVGSTGTVYLLGDSSTATMVRTLGAADVVVPSIPSLSTVYSNIAADAFGNILVVSRTSESIRAFAPGGGVSSTTITAPTSQAITIATPPSRVHDWSLF